MNALWSAYRTLAPMLGALAPAARAFVRFEERQLWDERLGRLTADPGCDAWIHAASMGEAGAVHALVPELVRAAPSARLHLSATTRTGRARLERLGHPVSLAPLDFPIATCRFFETVRPTRLILIETELWPHWLIEARGREVPVAIVSARLSAGSARRLARLGPDMRGLVASLTAVLAQGEEERTRWIDLGARPERTEVIGNLKAGALPQPAADRATARASMGLDPTRPLLVLGSVRPGEAAPLARAWGALPEGLRGAWQVVAVPRHAKAESGLQGEAGPAAQGWRWDARPGILNDYFAVADVAFVGGSLVPIGGHNPLEPAACGAAPIMGPHVEAQQEAVRSLVAVQALVVVADEAELIERLGEMLADPKACAEQGRRARQVADAMRGVASRAVERLAAHGMWPRP